MPKIEDSNEKEFYPAISNLTSKLVQDLDRGTGVDRNRLTVTLGGFYGTKAGALCRGITDPPKTSIRVADLRRLLL